MRAFQMSLLMQNLQIFADRNQRSVKPIRQIAHQHPPIALRSSRIPRLRSSFSIFLISPASDASTRRAAAPNFPPGPAPPTSAHHSPPTAQAPAPNNSPIRKPPPTSKFSPHQNPPHSQTQTPPASHPRSPRSISPPPKPPPRSSIHDPIHCAKSNLTPQTHCRTLRPASQQMLNRRTLRLTLTNLFPQQKLRLFPIGFYKIGPSLQPPPHRLSTRIQKNPVTAPMHQLHQFRIKPRLNSRRQTPRSNHNPRAASPRTAAFRIHPRNAYCSSALTFEPGSKISVTSRHHQSFPNSSASDPSSPPHVFESQSPAVHSAVLPRPTHPQIPPTPDPHQTCATPSPRAPLSPRLRTYFRNSIHPPLHQFPQPHPLINRRIHAHTPKRPRRQIAVT